MQRIENRNKTNEENVIQIGGFLSKEISLIMESVNGFRENYEKFEHFELIICADNDYEEVRDDVIDSLEKMDWENHVHLGHYYFHLICPAKKSYDNIIAIISFGKPEKKDEFYFICDKVICMLFLISKTKLKSLSKCMINSIDIKC